MKRKLKFFFKLIVLQAMILLSREKNSTFDIFDIKIQAFVKLFSFSGPC